MLFWGISEVIWYDSINMIFNSKKWAQSDEKVLDQGGAFIDHSGCGVFKQFLLE